MPGFWLIILEKEAKDIWISSYEQAVVFDIKRQYFSLIGRYSN